MAEVLVLIDHVDGKVRKTTSELLTIARRLGEPSAVYIGGGYDTAKETLASVKPLSSETAFRFSPCDGSALIREE